MKGAFLVGLIALAIAFAEKIRARHLLYAAVAVVAAALSWSLFQESDQGPGQLWHAATFYGSALITLGWIFTSEINIRNAKRQHTINVITQHAFDKTRIDNREKIKSKLPSYKDKLTPQIEDFDKENSDLLKAIDLEL